MYSTEVVRNTKEDDEEQMEEDGIYPEGICGVLKM